MPPHFDLASGEILTISEWEEILPGYVTFYPSTFRHVLLFLLASLVYHQDFIRNNFDKDHPIFNQRVWTSGVLVKLKDRVLAGCGRNPISKMVASGIPPHILLANEIVKLKEEIAYLKFELLKRLETLPEEIKKSMLENFKIDGTVPITHSQVESMMLDLKNCVISAISNQSEQTNAKIAELNKENLSSNNNIIGGNKYVTFYWNDRWHPVDKNFRFPTRIDTRTLWDLWWNGKPVDRIAPYRHLQTFDFFVKSDKQKLCRARRVINKLIHYSIIVMNSNEINDVSIGLKTNYIRDMSIVERDRVFEESYIKLYSVLSGQSLEVLDMKRVGEKSVNTIWDKINEFDKYCLQQSSISDDDEVSNNSSI